MYYKRQETFRYSFSETIPTICDVYVHRGRVKEKVQSFQSYILDLSPNGMKVTSKTDIELRDEYILTCSFQLSDTLIHFTGKMIRKRYAGTSFEYGIQSDGHEELKKQIIASLKTYSKEQMKKRRLSN